MKLVQLMPQMLAIIHLAYGVTDDTLTERAKGATVVETVCSKIDSVCIFPDDNLMLRRIAYVETNDGYDANTFTPGYYGGIWKVLLCQLFN